MYTNPATSPLLTKPRRALRSPVITVVAALAFAVGTLLGSQLAGATDAPKMGGGYTDVTPIPVNDPDVKEIAGARAAHSRGKVARGTAADFISQLRAA